MLRFLLKEKVINTIVDKITSEINISLDRHAQESNLKLNSISDNVEKLRFELKDLETQVINKEIRSRSDYGQIQYKLNSLQSELQKSNLKKRSPEKSH
jgi:archaellum component FlaC